MDREKVLQPVKNHSFNMEQENIFCYYVALMKEQRSVIFQDGLNKDLSEKVTYEGRGTHETEEDIRTRFIDISNPYGYIFFRKHTKDINNDDVILISGFMVYNGNIAKLKDYQVRNLLENHYGYKAEKNERYINSDCSVSEFTMIDYMVMQDKDISDNEKEQLKLKEQPRRRLYCNEIK